MAHKNTSAVDLETESDVQPEVTQDGPLHDPKVPAPVTRLNMPTGLIGGRGKPIEVDERLFLKSVERMFRVLEVFGASYRPLTLADIAKKAGMDKSGAQRICHTLLALNYLERDSGDRGFVPGKRLLERAFDYLRYNPLIERAIPVLIELRKNVQERVDLSLFDDLSVIYAYRLQSKRDTFAAALIGRRVPVYVSSGGRAILSYLPDDEVNDILIRSDRRPLTSKTITDIDEIWKIIRQARTEGYVLTQEEWLQGEIVIAAAITDARRRPVAAIHVSGSLSEWDVDEFRRKVAPLVMEAARALSGA